MFRGTRGQDDRDADEGTLIYTPSPLRVRTPQNRPENEKESPEENMENDENPPPEYNTFDEDHISPARRNLQPGGNPSCHTSQYPQLVSK